MSGAGVGQNAYIVSALNGNPVGADGGNSQYVVYKFDKIVNIGRIVLRAGVPYRLPDVPASWVQIYSKEENDPIWMGGYGTNEPAVGVGMPIIEGIPVTYGCLNANQFSFICEIDGNEIYVIAGGSGTEANVTPGNPAPLDTTPPTMVSIVPVNGATGVARNTVITITASEALDPATVNSTNVTLSPAATVTTSLDSGDPTKILIQPTGDLAALTLYTVTVTTNVKDTAGNALAAPYVNTFTTAAPPAPPDSTPPTVVSTNPASGQTLVLLSTSPTITFSEAMDPTTINSSTITIKATSPVATMGGLSYSMSTDNKTVTISGTSFAYSKAYQMDIIGGASGVKDTAGNALATTAVVTFSTETSGMNPIYNVVGNSFVNLHSGGTTGCCIKVADNSSFLFNKVALMHTLYMTKVGSPTGTVRYTWYHNPSNSSSLASANAHDELATWSASSISTGGSTLTADDSTNSEEIERYDMLMIEYSGGNSSNYIKVKVSDYQAVDNSHTVNARVSGGTITTFDSSDMAAIIQVER